MIILKYISVAIDGPAGAGKSTISKQLAKKLKFIYVDTGAIYRAIAYLAIQNSLDTKKNVKEITELAVSSEIKISYEDDIQHIYINNSDVTDFIRTPEVSVGASDVSAIPGVRDALLSIQRNLAHNNNVIMDGRDIGTVVLPDATVKIYLTASVEKRAERRYKDFLNKGLNIDIKSIREDIIYRDNQDTKREVAPLKPACDSVIFDNSNCNFDESVEYLYNIVKERI